MQVLLDHITGAGRRIVRDLMFEPGMTLRIRACGPYWDVYSGRYDPDDESNNNDVIFQLQENQLFTIISVTLLPLDKTGGHGRVDCYITSHGRFGWLTIPTDQLSKSNSIEEIK